MISEELKSKIDKSIERLKAFEPKEGYYLAFSGGKDSCVCKALLDMSGCKYDAHYRVTGIDPPELVRFIRDVHPDVHMEIPRYKDGKPVTMWNLIIKKQIPPTRITRYCCEYLKESGGDGRLTVTGVRWEESNNRKQNQGIATVSCNKIEMRKHKDFEQTKKGAVVLVNDNEESRRMIESCYKRSKTTLNPIIEWTYNDVWKFIRSNKISYCSLYDEGFQRIGCIGCPMARKSAREKEFARWPKIKNSYLIAFDLMLKKRKESGKDTNGKWVDAKGVFNWWMQYDVLPGQIGLFDEEGE